MKNQTVIVLDFGGQYNQLIARRVRECNVYCEVKPSTRRRCQRAEGHEPHRHHLHRRPQQRLSGGVAPRGPRDLYPRACPILGICYGCQLIAHTLGGKVTEAQDDTAREYGKTETVLRHVLHRSSSGLPEVRASPG